jgi:hypothetical protein
MTTLQPLKYEDLIKNMGLPNGDENVKKRKDDKKMTSTGKKRMINDIDKLDAKDHISILKIIKNHTSKKIYTINNYGCYIDLNDLGNECLHELRYFVDLCLDNQKRDREKEQVYQECMEQKQKHEEQFKNNKFKLGCKIKPISVAGDSDDEEIDLDSTPKNKDTDSISGSDDEEDEDDMMDLNDGLELELDLNLDDTTISDV